IAFTQPFRIEDAVVVEGEWGWIEEIGTMYVILRCWDLRRLVLPLSYFLDHAFQNWTYKSADLLAHCYIYTDYSVPVQALRDELGSILKSTPLWAGKVCVRMIDFLTRNYPGSLPRYRGEFDTGGKTERLLESPPENTHDPRIPEPS